MKQTPAYIHTSLPLVNTNKTKHKTQKQKQKNNTKNNTKQTTKTTEEAEPIPVSWHPKDLFRLCSTSSSKQQKYIKPFKQKKTKKQKQNTKNNANTIIIPFWGRPSPGAGRH